MEDTKSLCTEEEHCTECRFFIFQKLWLKCEMCLDALNIRLKLNANSLWKLLYRDVFDEGTPGVRLVQRTSFLLFVVNRQVGNKVV